MGIFELIRHETEHALVREANNAGSPDLKPVTVRLSPEHVALIDEVAENTNMSRQALLSTIVMAGIEEAVDGYSSVFSNPSEAKADIMNKCGFHDPVWGAVPDPKDGE